MTNVYEIPNFKWPKRIADVLAMPETDGQDMRAKHGKLTLIALKLFPDSPMQNAIRAEYQRIALAITLAVVNR